MVTATKNSAAIIMMAATARLRNAATPPTAGMDGVPIMKMCGIAQRTAQSVATEFAAVQKTWTARIAISAEMEFAVRPTDLNA